MKVLHRIEIAILVALSAIPLCYLPVDPLWAVVIATIVDLLGFGPTFRKVYANPHAESLGFFGLFAVRNGIAMMALESYSIATLLFPAAVGMGCLLLMLMIVYRRRSV
ncbi:MAG: hypothetical protein HC860_03125 [Alkalinema sp. RU_4_3]|nr:hypothetical protein [Alkalinema sp. RU_4_3]